MTMDSPTHFAISIVPTILLLALGLTRPWWPMGWKEVPATAFSAGLSLAVLLLAVSVTYGAGVEGALPDSPAVLLAALGACYAASLLWFLRTRDVKPLRLAMFGLIGLVPGYYLVGFTLVSSACGLQTTEGC